MKGDGLQFISRSSVPFPSQTSELNYSLYCCNWVDAPQKFRRILYMFMIRNKFYVEIDSKPFYRVDLQLSTLVSRALLCLQGIQVDAICLCLIAVSQANLLLDGGAPGHAKKEGLKKSVKDILFRTMIRDINYLFKKSQ